MFVFVADLFEEDYVGGAELTTGAIMEGSLVPVVKILSKELNRQHLQYYKKYHWVFGNFTHVRKEILLECVKEINYSVVEYDYKYCRYRSRELHASSEGACDCHSLNASKIVAVFLAAAKNLWWMSQKQKDVYCELYPFLNKENSRVLSSVFSRDTLKFIKKLRNEKRKRNDTWLILNSPSWIKATERTVQYAKDHGLKFELVCNLTHSALLKKMKSSKGLIFMPLGADTCPRIVIEAKLLGCELILNENVQHKDEKWFSYGFDEMYAYLSTRASYFWHEVENTIYGDDANSRDGSTKFKIVVPFYNAERWLPKCISSLKSQRYKNFECILIDDISTDDSYLTATELISELDNFKLIKNSNKKYALENIVNGIDTLNCDDEDVILMVDGDDWLANTFVLNRLNQIYSERDPLMTYGSYCYHPTGQIGVEPSRYPQQIVESNSFREDQWRASHLRTFKYKLWKNLNKKDLQDSSGKYYTMAYDQAIMLPLLEMASEKAVYIDDILYTYNRENPNNIDKTKAQKQAGIANEIRRKPKYKKL